MATFADRLKELRKVKEASQRQMSIYMDITERNYQRYEHGKADPSISKAIKLADYFDVSLDYLTGRTDIKNP